MTKHAHNFWLDKTVSCNFKSICIRIFVFRAKTAAIGDLLLCRVLKHYLINLKKNNNNKSPHPTKLKKNRRSCDKATMKHTFTAHSKINNQNNNNNSKNKQVQHFFYFTYNNNTNG